MQIVIDMPDTYITENIIRTAKWEEGSLFDQVLRCALKKAIILPKGHERLIEDRIPLSGIHFETELDHAMMIGRLNSAPTVVEADNEVEE